MTREEARHWLEIELKTWEDECKSKHPIKEALSVAIKALEQEPTTKNDLALIHTEGLDEGIRCAMCTNSMKSDRGCDGSCVVNNAMYKEVMDVIENHIQPTTKNDLGVEKVEVRKPCINYEDGCEEWAGCPCVHFKARK